MPKVIRINRICSAVVLAFLLSACSKPGFVIPTQHWKGTFVQVETRPTPPQTGMLEFIVITTDQKRRPVHDLIVSVRTDFRDPWKQAIQDGHVGVFRTAVPLRSLEGAQAQIRLVSPDAEKVLFFDLQPVAEVNLK